MTNDRAKQLKPIALSDLPRSKVACYRIEDAVLRAVSPLRVESRGLAHAIEAQRSAVPAWCEPRAWERMIDRMLDWVAVNGNLELWWRLRQKKED